MGIIKYAGMWPGDYRGFARRVPCLADLERALALIEGKASMNSSGKYRRKKRLSATDLAANLRMMATRLFRGISQYLRAMASIKCFSDMRLSRARGLLPI